jgi:hypothetical protein
MKLEFYYISDSRTGLLVAGPFVTRRAAQRKAHKLDLEYGAVRYIVKMSLNGHIRPL